MTLRLPIPAGFALALAAVCVTGQAQQLIGYVNTRDAEVTGASDVLDGQAVLTGSAEVTAREHAAPIKLGRGGTVLVCQTSALQVAESKSAEVAAPLLFSLNRGAIEIQMAGTLNDSIMTPDLRFTVATAGPMDLRLRVARNGDTCVENRGAKAPTLDISDPFGQEMYEVSAGQHVLFEHGSLHEVVDDESTPCGCPEAQAPSVADALLASGGGTSLGAGPAASAAVPVTAVPAAAATTTPAELGTAEQTAAQSAVNAADSAAGKAAEAHPFPAAISEGLAPAAEIPPPAPGAPHVQITDTLSYNAPLPVMEASAAAPAPAAKRKSRKAKDEKPAAAPARSQPPVNDVVHIVGRFFRKLFG